MEEKKLSAQESLQIIQQMILTAKKGIRDNGFFYLLWGWLVIIASLTEYFLIRMEIDNHGLVWIVMMTIGGIVSGVYGKRMDKTRKVKIHIDTLMSYLWGAFLISLFIFLYFSIKANVSPFPPLLVLSGMGTFVAGGALKFKPLIVGGISFWIFAIITFLLHNQYHLPLYALAMFLGYIIPGYMLKANFGKEN